MSALRATAAEPASCRHSEGAEKSALYVERCLMVSPATHPPCNAENPCDLILDEIRRGCQMIHDDRNHATGEAEPAWCAFYVQPPK